MKKHKIVKNTSPPIIDKSSYFLYEVCLYKILKNGFELLGIKRFKATKEIIIKQWAIYRKMKGFTLMKSIDLIAAPEEYLIKKGINYERNNDV